MVFRITLQVIDVLSVAIKELQSNSSNRQNVVDENSTKALSADYCFLKPEGANSARISYVC